MSLTVETKKREPHRSVTPLWGSPLGLLALCRLPSKERFEVVACRDGQGVLAAVSDPVPRRSASPASSAQACYPIWEGQREEVWRPSRSCTAGGRGEDDSDCVRHVLSPKILDRPCLWDNPKVQKDLPLSRGTKKVVTLDLPRAPVPIPPPNAAAAPLGRAADPLGDPSNPGGKGKFV